MREKNYGLLVTPSRALATLCSMVALFLLSSGNTSFAQPMFMSFPNDVTVECTQIPPKTPPVAGSNCLPVNVALSEIETIGACPQTKVIQRIWTATDNCGKTLQQTHTVTIRDTKAPKITFTRQELVGKKSGDTITLDCRYAYGLGTQDVFVEDNCDDAVTVTFKDNLIRAGNCAIDKYLLFMNCSWIAVDACGNRSESNIYIKFIDVSPPELWGQPANITVECEGQIDFSKAPYFKDYCDGQPTLKEVKNTTVGSCAGNFLVTRNWVATDVCGNSASVAQVITVKDTKPPIIISKPIDVTIKQGDVLPLPGKVTATDNCNQETYQKLTEEKKTADCDSVLVRTWDVKDACGNSTLAIQKITILIKKASTGKIVADTATVCLENNKAKVSAKETIKPTLPTGYKTIYLLSDKNGTITQTATIPSFDVSLTNFYSIHTLVYDARFDVKLIKKDSTTITQLAQQLKDLCAAFDVEGAKIRVKICNIIPKDSACVKPAIIGIAITKTDCDSTNGSIKLQINQANVTFKWENSNATSANLKDLKAGVYSVTISKTTDNQCFITEKIIVNSKNNYTISSPTITPTACNKNNGEAIFPDTIYTYQWFDGKKTAQRNDLAAGTYYVSVTKDSSSCVEILKIEIESFDVLTANTEILQQPDCGDNNGAVNIKVEGGSGKYTFSWGGGAKRVNLIAGAYHVTITDDSTGCKTVVDFELINNKTPDVNLIKTKIENTDCVGSLVKLSIELTLPQGFAAPAKVRVVDAQNKIYDATALASGNYTILVFDANECLVATKPISIAPKAPFISTFTITEALCKGNIEVTTTGGTTPYKYDWADVSGTDNDKDRWDLKAGKYTVTVTDSKGCSAIMLPEISDKTCGDTCINWIPERNISISTKDCAAGASICFPIPLDIFKAKISTLANGKPYNGAVESCRQSPQDSVAYAKLSFPIGKHEVIFTQKRGKNTCHDTVSITVICDNCPVIYSGETTLTADSCKGTAKLCLDVTQQYLNQVKILEKGQPFTGVIGTCSNGKPQLELKTGNYDFQFRDTLWGCDKSLKIKVRCDTLKDTPVNSLVIELDMCVGDSFTYVLDTMELNKGPYKVENLCPGTYKAIKVDVKGLVVKVKADTIGIESLCMYVCDPYKRCDTTYLVFNVKKCTSDHHKVDTIYKEILLSQKDTVCLKGKDLASVDTIYNYCESVSGKAVKFSYEGKCVKFQGEEIGREQGCFVICDKSGKCDTTIIIVTVKQIPKPKSTIDTLYREIKIDNQDTVCLKIKSLVNVDTIYNYCTSASGTVVKFSLKAKNNCITYRGLEKGQEKGCFVICDSNGKCDTTIVYVKVFKDDDTTNIVKRPLAVKDLASTTLDIPVTIEVLKNDLIVGTLKTMKVYKFPTKGDAYYTVSGGKQAITYIPKPNNCSFIDTFYYYIEDEYGRDSTSVCVAVTCQQLIIFNGFSPNSDGVNDVFTILGIEEFGDNKVTIINRWGNTVFQKESYTNLEGWDGSWNGQELPDGTYWYYIEIPRLNKVYNGFIEMKR